jgi:DNA-binding CsgD family transcriptional regulator
LVLHITPVERAVLQLLADGKATTSIAARLRMTDRAVEALLTALFERMGAAGRSEAVAAAGRRGLLHVPPAAIPLPTASLYICPERGRMVAIENRVDAVRAERSL